MTRSLPANFIESISRRVVRKEEGDIKYGPIGIDLGPNGLRLVQFRTLNNVLEIHASAHVLISQEERNSGKQFRQLIKQALKQNAFVGREIVTSIQPADVKVMMLSFMQQADKKDEELVVQRVAERIDDSIDNYVIDYMMVRPEVGAGQERSVLAALAHRDDVMKQLEFLRTAGLTVKVLEIEPTAVRRLISVKHGNENDANLMAISIGESHTYITVLSGRRLIYERDIDIGEQQLISALCKELEIDEHEARTMLVNRDINIATETDDSTQEMPVTVALYSVLKPLFMELVEDINRALIYAASETRGLPVKHVYLTDRVATWQGIENFINTLIEVPVSVLTPFEGFNNAAEFCSDSGPRGAVVTGLALHGITEIG